MLPNDAMYPRKADKVTIRSNAIGWRFKCQYEMRAWMGKKSGILRLFCFIS
jgi:hypothetical protein